MDKIPALAFQMRNHASGTVDPKGDRETQEWS